MPQDNNNRKPYETIIFDLDGTLIDSSITNLNGFNYALNPFNIQVSSADVERMRTMTDKELFLDYLSAKQAKKALKRLWDYSHQSAGDTLLISGVKPLLDKMSNMNLTIGLWTGRDRSSAVNILKAHKIQHYFKQIVGGCDVKKNKPSSDGLLLLADKLNVSLNTMIHVGDHEHDLVGASSAGVKVAHAKWLAFSQNDTQSLPIDEANLNHPFANFTFHTIDEFHVWLDKNFINSRE